ncbi:hypothetical protein MKEN_00416500 [Mycena kentingensis (nom. inval.)]|nr:hypothetical protein MKEN_00416500 [Mycena kentingensis (nom. inval.)]
MPQIVTKIDVTSSVVQYSGPWVAGGGESDPIQRYDENTFLTCEAPGTCTAVLKFHGTEVHVVGSHRQGHGQYGVQLDGANFGPFTPSTDPEVFQVDLFNRTGLTNDAHTITISNVAGTGNEYVYDLDYFTFTSTVESTSDSRLEDTHSAFSYSGGSWTTDVSQMPGFDAGTGHIGSVGAEVNLSFSGDRVAIYGAVGSQGAPYSVQLDGGTVESYSQAIKVQNGYMANQLIYYATGLKSGNHTVQLKSTSTNTLDRFTIDYAVVDGNANPAGIIATGMGTAVGKDVVTSNSSGVHLSIAQLSGIAAGFGVLLLALILMTSYTVLLRRRLSPKSAAPPPSPSPYAGSESGTASSMSPGSTTPLVPRRWPAALHPSRQRDLLPFPLDLQPPLGISKEKLIKSSNSPSEPLSSVASSSTPISPPTLTGTAMSPASASSPASSSTINRPGGSVFFPPGLTFSPSGTTLGSPGNSAVDPRAGLRLATNNLGRTALSPMTPCPPYMTAV